MYRGVLNSETEPLIAYVITHRLGALQKEAAAETTLSSEGAL